MNQMSGIQVSNNLKKIHASATTEETEVDVVKQCPATGSWEEDFHLITDNLDVNDPSYILYRLDSKNNLGYESILFTYVPDKASNDLTLESYRKYMIHKNSDAPLTQAEELLKEETEQGVFVGGQGTGIATSNSYIKFPVEDSVDKALKNLSKNNYVQIYINAKDEKILLGPVGNLKIEQINEHFNDTSPRFHVYRWDHKSADGSKKSAILFIYSCPDGSGKTKSAPVKERMLYSSSRGYILDILKQSGIVVDQCFECANGSEINEEHIFYTLYPKPIEKMQTFARPKAAGSGKRNLTSRVTKS